MVIFPVEDESSLCVINVAVCSYNSLKIRIILQLWQWDLGGAIY
jgi:hypothetical protein